MKSWDSLKATATSTGGRTSRSSYSSCISGGVEIELLEPIEKDDPHNPLSSYLQTPLYKMYHMCYEVDDLEDAVEKLKEQGFRVVGKSWLDKTHHDRRMLFLFHRRMGLVEIGEKTV